MVCVCCMCVCYMCVYGCNEKNGGEIPRLFVATDGRNTSFELTPADGVWRTSAATTATTATVTTREDKQTVCTFRGMSFVWLKDDAGDGSASAACTAPVKDNSAFGRPLGIAFTSSVADPTVFSFLCVTSKKTRTASSVVNLMGHFTPW